MKHIRIEDIHGYVPDNYYDEINRPFVDDSIGAKGMKASLVRMGLTGRGDPHTHENAEQLFIVLNGEMVIKAGEEVIHVKQGEAALVYPGEVHESANVAGKETEYIVITSLIP